MRPGALNTGDAAQPDAQALRRALGMLAPVLELFDTSPLHYLHKVSFLVDRLLPSLLNGQFRLLMRGDKPLAFVNWAWVTPEISAQLAASRHDLTREQWNCGPDLWFCEIVVRDGMMHELIRDQIGRAHV